MKMKKTVYMVMLTAAALLCSCVRENFVEPSYNEGLSLSVGGSEIFRYDPLLWQASSGTDNVFVMQRDDEKCWYRLSCNDCPTTLGEEINADLSWQKEGDEKSSRMKNLKFKVSAEDSETGMMHLWSQEKGVAVMILSAR